MESKAKKTGKNLLPRENKNRQKRTFRIIAIKLRIGLACWKMTRLPVMAE